jgi:predicted RNA-binding protein with PIN domain
VFDSNLRSVQAMASQSSRGSATDAGDPRADVELELLRSVAELAVVIAQAGQRVNPVVVAPVALRPYLRFTRKVPAPALRVARRVIDDDEEWRARVALVATEALVGRAGFLYAHRPEGWVDEFDKLVLQEISQRSASSDEVVERDAQRRLVAAQEAAKRSEAQWRVAEEALVLLRTEHSAVVASLAAQSQRVIDLQAHVNDLRAAVVQHTLLSERAQRERDELRVEAEGLRDIVGELTSLRDERQAVFDAANNAIAGLDLLRGQLSELRSGVAVDSFVAMAPAPTTRAKTPSRAERAALATQRVSPAKPIRATVTLPPAVFSDSVEAARFLLRVRRALIFVDGYNVAKRKWPSVGPLHLRTRLDAALADVAARADAEICVVYDGVDEGGAVRVTGSIKRAVRVVFSSGDVEADDVILDLVSTTPVNRPVVVISNDRRVQDGARALGANVISSDQFIASWGAVL